MALKHEIDKLIFEWVKENFGESEAHDPSWSIVELANYLADHFGELFWYKELEYLKEDVKNYIEGTEYKLDEQQIYNVADKIRNSDWYCSINPEDMEYYIKAELEKGE